MERLINAKVDIGRVAIHWLGQGGFAFKGHTGPVIAVDPYLSDSLNDTSGWPRLEPIPVKPRDLAIDFLFLTHDHIDHTDPFTVPILAQSREDLHIFAPPSSVSHLIKRGVSSQQLIAVTPGQTISLEGLTAHVVPAQHTEDSVGFIFEFSSGAEYEGDPIVYITGDTEYHEALFAPAVDFAPDVLIVPINGKMGNMSAHEAAKLTSEILPTEVIPMHYGMFEENTVDPTEFTEALAEMLPDNSGVSAVVMVHNTCHLFGGSTGTGRKARKEDRADRARRARASHEHHDGLRSPGTASRR